MFKCVIYCAFYILAIVASEGIKSYEKDTSEVSPQEFYSKTNNRDRDSLWRKNTRKRFRKNRLKLYGGRKPRILPRFEQLNDISFGLQQKEKHIAGIEDIHSDPLDHMNRIFPDGFQHEWENNGWITYSVSKNDETGEEIAQSLIHCDCSAQIKAVLNDIKKEKSKRRKPKLQTLCKSFSEAESRYRKKKYRQNGMPEEPKIFVYSNSSATSDPENRNPVNHFNNS